MENILIIGGRGDIAKAIVKELFSQNANINIFIVTSKKDYVSRDDSKKNFEILYSDYSEQSIEEICSSLKLLGLSFSEVFIFNGVLSAKGSSPEKKIEDLTAFSLEETFRINAIVPALWIKNLLPVLKNTLPCRLLVFSARLGSITDNNLGGWYSYRCSKAALNMLVKTASIEYERRAKNVSFILFHPGTVDTKLSKPFTQNRGSSKLFSPESAAKNLFKVLSSSKGEKKIQYLDWQGKIISW